MNDAQGGNPSAVSRRMWSRRSVRVVVTLAIGGISVGLLFWVAPPASVVRQLDHMNPAWVLAAVLFEVASCLGYVVFFRRFFPEPPRAVSRQVAWIAMGAGAVLPGGNFSSAATTGWLLRTHGIGARKMLERAGAMLCFLTLFGFVVNG